MAQGESADDGQEKRHQPTEHRLQKAREEGQVGRSSDAPKVALMAAFAIALVILGGSVLAGARAAVAGLLASAGGGSGAVGRLGGGVLHVLLYLSLFLLACWIVAVAASLLSGGWVFSARPVTPDPNRLNPASGIKNLFSPQRLSETAKALLKFLLVGSAGAAALRLVAPRLAALSGSAAPDWGLSLAPVAWVLGACVAASLPILAADVPLQAWMHRRRLRMTDTELRDERKDTEGNPQVKSRMRTIQRRAAQARMMERLPESSVVVVNPAHYAVALRYRQQQDDAPLVIAKGAGMLAARIRERARRHRIPVVTAPPLTRALFFHSEPGDRIPTALYQACAEVLAYVWRLQLWTNGQGEQPSAPDPARMAVDPRLDPLAGEHD
ncbi:MAG TPA: EscU/YscU/HrcU family type III secretion system export apparatus switch protein [Gammaproteobacteria bacterium]|nr:EscU/YscU/HrcU family type III secretion system export apparatus switch protein [Gammaproteobacteria bacterium]